MEEATVPKSSKRHWSDVCSAGRDCNPPNMGLRRNGSAANAQVLNERSSTSTGSQVQETSQDLPSEQRHIEKRPKIPDGQYAVEYKENHHSSNSTPTQAVTNDPPCTDCLLKDQLYEQKQGELLVMKQELSAKGQEIAANGKRWYRREEQLAATVNEVHATLRFIKVDRFEVVRQLEEEKTKNIKLEKAINDVKLETSIKLLALSDRNKQLQRQLALKPTLPLKGPSPRSGIKTSLISANAPSKSRGSHHDHDNPHYQAPNASTDYGNCKDSGKVWPSAYRSNYHWDLGLCHVALNTWGRCRSSSCKWRHSPLLADERAYIATIKPNGPRFLENYDRFMSSSRT